MFGFLLCLLCVNSVSAQSAKPQSDKVADLFEEWDPAVAAQRYVVGFIEGGRALRVKLSSRVRSVERVSAYGADRLLVVGHTGGAEVLTVVSRRSATVEDEFLAYASSVSPSGRYIAFERFWQPSGPSVAPVVMIYDLESSTRGNRVAEVTGLDALKYVGRPIYPLDHGKLRVYREDPLVKSSSRRISNLFWLDPETVSFIAYIPGESRVVTLRGEPDFSRPQYASYFLDHKLVVNERALGIGDDPALQFAGAAITVDDSGRTITIQLLEGSQFKARTLSLLR